MPWATARRIRPNVSKRHEPVLVRESVAYLAPRPGLFLDATLGDGGHAEALLLADSQLRLLANDRDRDALAGARARLARFGDRVTFAHGTFRELPAAHTALGAERLAGALFDFGVSSRQIDDAARGMSYLHAGPLDLRMDASRGTTLADRLASTTETELAEVLRVHGDVGPARSLARAVLAAHRDGALGDTRALAAVVARVLRDPRPGAAAPVFQALRIWVNDEMADLESALQWLPEAMADGGVVVTLSYHSGEDRRVKQALRGVPDIASRRLPPRSADEPSSPWEELTRKVVVPAETEQQTNPRARSARLRAFRRKPR
jgi:16S rRNA (cytosine1402-N4)-methyltransferase